MSLAVEERDVGLPTRPKPRRETAVEFTPRPRAASWSVTRRTRTEVLARLTHAPFVAANPSSQHTRVLGVKLVLDWLADQPGLSWQDRWLSSGADAAGPGWRQLSARWLQERGHRVPSRQSALSEALPVLISADVIRPSLSWLLAGTAGQRSLVRNLAASRDREGFTRLRTLCDGDPRVSAVARNQTLYRSALIVAAKGGALGNITVGDVLELFEAEDDGPRTNPATGRTLFYRSLSGLGILGDQAPGTLRELRTTGQRTPEELIDRYRLACRPVRDVLVDYLRERQPALDYTSLDALSYHLAKRSWADIEAHHPGIDNLALSAEAAQGWKRRLRTTRKTTRTPTGQKIDVEAPRINYRECLTPVRAFYLDLAHWAVEDPSRWAVGRALPGRRGGDQPAQGQTTPQVTDGRPHPRTATRAPGRRPMRRPAPHGQPSPARGRPPRQARRGLHRRGNIAGPFRSGPAR